MSITYELSVDHNVYPHLTVWDRLQGGRHAGFRVNAEQGFVFYDSSEEREPVIDPMTGEKLPVEIYYARVRYLPRNYDWSKFALCAVREEETAREM